MIWKGFLVLCGGLASISMSDAAASCSCTGVCAVYGDPHVISFFGKTTTITLEEFTLYEVGDFKVTGNTYGRHWMNEISFNGIKVNASECSSPGEIIRSFSHDFHSGDKLTMDVICNFPHNRKLDNKLHLDAVLVKVDIGTGDFQSLEQDQSASGVCISSTEADLLTWSYHEVKPTCDCLAICSATGDPHLDSFYGKRDLISQPTFTLYEDQGFSIKAEDFGHYYMGTFWFGEEVITVQECKHDGHQIANLTHNFRDGDSVSLFLFCKSAKRRHVHGLHLDAYIHKVDKGKAADFRSMEIMERSDGLCTTL